jgi:hypothetical protein
MDLRKDFPRSMRVKMADYVHLARMIDKCRAVLAGTEGEYIYPCPMDDRLMEFTGITADQFTAAVKGNPHPPAELDAWNRMMLSRGPSTPKKQEYFHQLRNAVDPTRTDLTAWADLQDLEEGRHVPRQEPVA